MLSGKSLAVGNEPTARKLPMPANRESRDAAADALASFMRGELDGDALQMRFEAILSSCQGEATGDDYLDSLLSRWEPPPWKYWAATEEEWNGLRRQIAFLKSDLPERPICFPTPVEDRPYQILLARWHTLGLVVASGFSFHFGWWWFAVASVVSFVLYQIALSRHEGVHEEEQRTEARRLVAFLPFTDEEEWLAHEGLLQNSRLPSFTPHPRHRTTGETIRDKGILVVCGVVTGCMFGYMYVFSVFMWPLCLLLMSLCKRETLEG